jgi:putative transposase
MFFVTACCAKRGANQLCHTGIGRALLDFAQFYHTRGDWFIRVLLLMPDHLHALIAPAPDKNLSRLLGDWKRFATTQQGIDWQKNFIDHRLRSDESCEEKARYIRLNPVRAGLMREEETWPYMIEN